MKLENIGWQIVFILVQYSYKQKRNEPITQMKEVYSKEEKREIIQNYIELKSTYKVAKKMNISQSKVARIIKQYREQSDSVFRS